MRLRWQAAGMRYILSNITTSDYAMRPSLRLAVLAIALACNAPAFADAAAQPHVAATSVTVSGAVERPSTINVEDLRKRPEAQVVALQQPAREGGKASTVRGVRLRDLLDDAKIVSRDHNTVKKLVVIASATDGYKVVFSWSELFNSPLGEQVLVLFERDGKPLDAEEGPLALISGKDLRTGPRHVKWLQAVEVRQVVD
jgi:DMSO/TMAO reductase YedYZ molybdopterin-dependent catalytic subunit